MNGENKPVSKTLTLEELKSAGELALEVSPETKYFIYAYLDNALKKYVPPFIQDKEPSFMVEGLKNSVIKGTCKPEQFAGMTFCFVGTFELSSGKLEAFDVPVKLVDLDVLFSKFGGLADGNKVC